MATSTATTPPVNPIALGVAAEGLDDLLTMLGVDPDERQVEDVHGIDTPMGDATKEIVARAAVRAYLEAQAQVDREGYNPPGTVASVRVRPQRYPDSWHQVTIKTVAFDQRPYADVRTTYEITFTGGTPANTPGVELPHATHPPFRRELHEDTPTRRTTRFPPRTIEELEEEHYGRIKDIARALIYGGWEADCSGPSKTRGMGQIYLERFEHIGGSTFENTYRAVVVKPNMD